MQDRTGTPTTGSAVRVLAFAGVRDVVGAAELDIAVPAPCGADDLWAALIRRFPALAPYRGSVRLAINGTYASAEDLVAAGDEVALIPPVAGG